jgi:hypothetical protein
MNREMAYSESSKEIDFFYSPRPLAYQLEPCARTALALKLNYRYARVAITIFTTKNLGSHYFTGKTEAANTAAIFTIRLHLLVFANKVRLSTSS